MVTGRNFVDTAELACRFGEWGALSPARFVSDSAIACTAPPHLPGPVAVHVTLNGVDFGDGASPPATFTYVAGVQVQSVTPQRGPVSGFTQLTVTGVNFAAGAASDALWCLFEDQSASERSVATAAAVPAVVLSDTQAQCATPPTSAVTAVSVTLIPLSAWLHAVQHQGNAGAGSAAGNTDLTSAGGLQRAAVSDAVYDCDTGAKRKPGLWVGSTCSCLTTLTAYGPE